MLIRGHQPFLRADYRSFWLHSLDGADADHWTQNVRVDLILPVKGRVGLGATGEFIRRRTYYEQLPDVCSVSRRCARTSRGCTDGRRRILARHAGVAVTTIDRPKAPGALTSLARALRSWRTASVALLSFSSGLPLGLVWYSIPDWMRDIGVDIRVVGLFTLAQAPWAFKVLWSPLMDRYVPPFWGRRRGWMAVTQIALG